MTTTLSETILNALVLVAADRIGASPQDVAARLDNAVERSRRAAQWRLREVNDTMLYPALRAA